jgi:topoisomerase-4 subunit A
MVYRSGKAGSPYYVKRFSVKGITHDKDYDLTKGEPGSKVVYFSANPNGEAEVIKVMLRPQPKLKKTSFEYNFADLAIKGRASQGNRLTMHPINKIVKRDEGVSTLAAREIWYDDTVKRLNADKRGTLIGEFSGDDKILQVFSNGEFRLTGYDLSTHFDDDMTQIMKYDPSAIYSVIYIEGETKLMYIKRFDIDDETPLNRRISFIGENENAQFLMMNMDKLPRLLLSFNDSASGKQYEDEELNVAEYIGVKSYKAKGKRLSTKDVSTYTFLEPYEPQEEEVPEDVDVETPEDDAEDVENITPEVDNSSKESDDNFFSEDDGVQLTLFE